MHTLNQENINEIASKAAETIKNGGIALVPFDTVYGFICDPSNSSALEKIFHLKERDENKTIGLAVSSLSDIEKIAETLNPEFISARIPGRYTFILKSKNDSFSKYCYQNGTIGVRVPDNSLIIKIASLFGPIAQTSANKSGLSNCLSIPEVIAQFPPAEFNNIDLIVDGGKIENGKPSQIWDMTKKEPSLIER